MLKDGSAHGLWVTDTTSALLNQRLHGRSPFGHDRSGETRARLES
jgi:hypothetical protein